MYKKLKNIPRFALSSILGLVLGVTGTLSFLGTNWGGYRIDFFFWWSIVSTIFGFLFLVFAVWQYLKSENQIDKSKAQIKVWMQDAQGIRTALQRIVRDNLDKRYSTTNDMGNAVWGVEATAGSLYQSLYEERCVTEEEYIARQRKYGELIEKQQFSELEAKASQVTTNQ